MKNNILIILGVLGFLVAVSSCKKDEDPQINESVMLIDSIAHPDTVAFGSTLTINFYGVIGNGCDSFSRFEDVELNEGEPQNTFKIRIYRKTEDQPNCTEELKYLDSSLNLTGMLAGTFYIKVVQPDGSYLEGEVFVEE